MDTFDKIVFLLQSQKRSQKELCDYLDLHAQAFTDWKSGKSESYKKYLPQIASFFKVPVDFLLDGIQEDTRRQRLAMWVCGLTDEELDRTEALLRAANLLPDTF